MSIEEVDIPELNNDPPKFKPNLYPVPYKKHISPPYYIFVASGQRGSGKTFGIVRHILNAEQSGFYDPITNDKVKIKTFLFSPTAESNPVFNALKSLDEDDIINEYTDEKLLEIIEQIQEERKQVKDYRKYVEAYKRYEKMSEVELRRCTDWDFLGLLMAYDYVDYRELEKPDQYLYMIILDDCITNKSAFSSKKSNVLTKAILNSRHIGICLYIATQHIKMVSKSVRGNVDIWMLFKTKNEKMLLEDVYPELSALVSPEEFLTLYHYATSASDNDSLVYDAKEKDKKDRFKLNFDVILRLK
jgi:hypothetical protein